MSSVIIQERLMIPSDLKFLGLVRNFILNVLHQTNKIAPDKENKIVLAVDEAVTNIIEHAYEFQKSGYINIKMIVDHQKIQVVFLNTGKQFNPESIKSPDILQFVKNKKRKGFGLYLMKQVMDEIKYSINDGENQLSLIKYI
jgi:serine/threonine-protein kinase RsbW